MGMSWRPRPRPDRLDAAWEAFAQGLCPPYDLTACLATALDGLAALLPAPAYYAYVAESDGHELTLRATRAAAGTPEVGPNYAGLVTGVPLPQVPLVLPRSPNGERREDSSQEPVRWDRTHAATPLLFVSVCPEVTLAVCADRAPSGEVREHLSQYARRIGPVIGLLIRYGGESRTRRSEDLQARTQEQAVTLALDMDRLLVYVARMGEGALRATDGYAALVTGDGHIRPLWESGASETLLEAMPPDQVASDPAGFRAALWRAPDVPGALARLSPPRTECAAVVGRSAAFSYVAVYATPTRVRPADPTFLPETLLTAMVEAAERVLSRREDSLKAARIHLDTLRVLARLLDAVDPFGVRHHERVADLAVELGREMGLGAGVVADLRTAGEVHDVGMISTGLGLASGWTDRVLGEQERQVLREHPVIGAGVLGTLPEAVVPARVARAVRHHHERYDGSGYPDGLSGEDIPLEARILAVAEVFTARTTARSYRPALGQGRALYEIQRVAARELDPKVVAGLERILGRSQVRAEPPDPV